MSKWDNLVAALLAEKDLLLGRLTAEELQSLHVNGLGWIEEYDGEIVACTFLFATPAQGWYELGSVWVAPVLRGTGLGAVVFRGCAGLIKKKGHNAFLITKSDKVIHLAQATGFSEATTETWRVVPWNASCGPCDRLKDEHKSACPFRATAECRLFFMD
jgi:N-acetylglutamate synthase-like GNAT family acetyltransferase